MEQVMWLVLGVTVMVASVFADRSSRARLVGEATAGILVLSGGRRLEVGLALLIAFHVGLLFFGWWLWLYAVPMLGALILLRAERRAHPRDVRVAHHGVRRTLGTPRV